jgi:hypothetical protein
LTNGLRENIDDIIFNGHPEYSLPNLISLSIKYIEGESIVLMLDEENIAVATKSACASGSLRASHVLIAIGRDYADAQGTLVITYGRDTTENDISRFLECKVDTEKNVSFIKMIPAKDAILCIFLASRAVSKTKETQYVAFCLLAGAHLFGSETFTLK